MALNGSNFMTQSPPQIAFKGTRLVRLLSDMAVSDVEVSHKQFTERLGRLIDLSESIALSEAHWKASKIKYEPTGTSSEKVKDEFLRVRGAMVQSVIKTFVPSAGPTLIKLPKVKPEGFADKSTAYESYKRFYVAHQREIDFKIQNLQSYVRDAVSGYSTPLAKLAALDVALNAAIEGHTRKFLLVIPRLLGKRFDYLYNEHLQQSEQADPESWMLAGAWLDKFCREMQGVLLAEIDIRLQPVLGLVEALNKEVDKDQ